ncbi:uncharacterized protein (TIGR02118 family) [Rhizobium sp. SLBN-94]|nr:uncharacterized protein (TIGR02118 family) [Rhizobium sp. SLBN-94]
MIVRMGLFRRKPELTVEDFARHWRETHGALVRDTFGTLEAYIQNLVTDKTQKGIAYERSDLEIDAISQLFFPTLTAMRGSVNEENLKRLQEDEANFLTDLMVATAFQNTVIPVQKDAKRVKRMSLLKRKPGISTEEFQGQWFNDHAALVKRLPGLLGYRQNIIIDWQTNRFSDGSDSGELALDGIVELWFEDEAAIERGFKSAQGQTAMMHAKEFLGQISTYVVNPVEIIPEREISRQMTLRAGGL